MAASIDHNALYRLPWNYADNGISWLEPTTACNLHCAGCYRDTSGRLHKSPEEIQAEFNIFNSLRKSDCMSITGGDPLVHPKIAEIVKMAKDMGWKPILNTNGLALKEKKLEQLKEAGVFGFTFHIDTSQTRPKVHAKTEAELNELRLHYANMLAKAGGIACSFNATVSENTISQVPDLVNWAQEHAKSVQTMVFILYRSPNLAGDDFDVFANGHQIEFNSLYEETEWGGKRILMSPEVAEKIKEADPLYEPSAYLNGTADPASLKWLLATRVIFNGKVMGYVSPRFQEFIQVGYHFLKGRYLSYARPKSAAMAKSASFFMGIVDKKMRKIFFRILSQMIRNPLSIFKHAYFQSFMIIQPINIKEDGRQDMCDSCPDITVHNGRLVWSCRLEELNSYDSFCSFVPKSKIRPVTIDL